eukprot:Platyproteum_vivax@DN14867_c0_g1_i1.p1
MLPEDEHHPDKHKKRYFELHGEGKFKSIIRVDPLRYQSALPPYFQTIDAVLEAQEALLADYEKPQLMWDPIWMDKNGNSIDKTIQKTQACLPETLFNRLDPQKYFQQEAADGSKACGKTKGRNGQKSPYIGRKRFENVAMVKDPPLSEDASPLAVWIYGNVCLE